jgi:hypothetical protein
MTTDQYPGILTKLDVVLTSPLKLRAYFHLPNSTKEITTEGVVYQQLTYAFADLTALVACRSLSCIKLTL